MQKLYITSSLPYVNAAPHAGFAMEIIEADTIARFFRQRGVKTRFQTGTDEHGLKIQKTAAAQNLTPTEICATNSDKFYKLKNLLNLSFDDFIRTSDNDRHFPGAQKMWQALKIAGKLEKRQYQGIYCAGCEAFLLKKDLKKGHCANHFNLAIEEIQEENWFFRLSDFSKQIVKLIETKKVAIVPEFRATEFLNLARQGLHDVSFSRPRKNLTWGVPVPDDNSQTMYVWCDALTNYISALGYGKFKIQNSTSNFQEWWNEENLKVHVIGKDIVRFHAGIWLGMLLAAKLPLPNKIFVHGFLTSEGQKMSKTIGNVVEPAKIVEQFGVDALRYFLLAEIPVGRDGDFSQKRFQEIYHANLADALGNLVNRVINLARKMPDFKSEISLEVEKKISQMWQEAEKAMENFDFRVALAAIFALVNFANKFVDQKKPWELKNEEKQKVIFSLLEILRQVAFALQPFLPESAKKIGKILGVENLHNLKEAQNSVKFKLQKPEILFPKYK
jgi:methionyl-tRNA synthetase